MARKQVLEPLSFLSEHQAWSIADNFGTPVYVYSQSVLEEQADRALAFPNPFGLTVRYAMKANPNANILRIFHNKGIQIDASSGYEAERAILAGIPAKNILLTSQQVPDNLSDLVRQGVEYNACSLDQLEHFGEHSFGREISVRINPGLGSGGTNRTNTGGEGSSFGIWHEQFDRLLKMLKEYDLRLKRVHTHIGSGSDPEVWKKVAGMSLDMVARFFHEGQDGISIINLGGGYKVGRMSYDVSTDLQECGKPVAEAISNLADVLPCKLHLEIEPGTFLVANAGCIVSQVVDIKSSSKYDFVVVDSGMTENTRISLYGAQHPITVIPDSGERNKGKFIVFGHCCESGDILTPKPGDPETLSQRVLLKPDFDDLIVIGGCGAYCSSMSSKNYNSYPEAAEVLIDKRGKMRLIRARQELSQMIQNEKRVVKLNR